MNGELWNRIETIQEKKPNIREILHCISLILYKHTETAC